MMRHEKWRLGALAFVVALVAALPGTARAQCVPHIGVDTAHAASADSHGASRSPTRCPGFVATWDTVRLVLTDLPEVRGVLTRADSSGMYVSPTVGKDSVFYPVETIRHADVHSGFRERGPSAIAEGTLIGLGTGVGFTAAMAAGSQGEERAIGVALGVIGTIFTTLTGFVVGNIAAASQVDLWTPFDPRTFRILGSAASQ